jgi:beta-glucosidase/6-phospho-beta-glucosidase/beta-galactosidase
MGDGNRRASGGRQQHEQQWWKWEQDGHTDGKSGLAAIGGEDAGSEDFDRAAEAGQNAHRLSVEWSRIQPTPDTWDEDALERYRAMLRGLKERGMTPMVTLHHFTDPLWLANLAHGKPKRLYRCSRNLSARQWMR